MKRSTVGGLEGLPLVGPFSGRKTEFQPGDLVCHCFGFTRADIELDYDRNGDSTILSRIAAEKRSGGCDCANKNPRGR